MATPFAVNQFTTKRNDFEADLTMCRRLEVPWIELCQAKLADDESVQRQQLIRLSGSDIRLCSVQPKVHSVFPDRLAPEPQEPEERLRAYCRCMQLIREYIPEQDLPFVAITGAAPENNFHHGRSVVVESLKYLSERASDYGFRIAFEPIHPYFMQRDTFVWSLDEAIQIIDEVDSPQVGLVIDLFHLWQEPAIEARLRQIAPRVLMVHVSDWPDGGPRSLDDRRVPGFGCIPIEGILQALALGGYQGPHCIEILSDESLPDSLWNEDPTDVVLRSRGALDAMSIPTPLHTQSEP